VSIATVASSLITVCWSVSDCTATDTRDVDTNLASLHDEVQGLSRASAAIAQSWNSIPRAAIKRADPDGTLWQSVNASIDECNVTLKKLKKKVDSVGTDGLLGHGFLRKPVRQIKLDLGAKDIANFRAQIQSHNTGLHGSMHMITV
jgi:hypothetical protein